MATAIPTMFYRRFCQVETHVHFMNRPTFGQYRISVLLLAECSLTGCSKPQLCEFFLEGKRFSSGGNIFGDTTSLSHTHTPIYVQIQTCTHNTHSYTVSVQSWSIQLCSSINSFSLTNKWNAGLWDRKSSEESEQPTAHSWSPQKQLKCSCHCELHCHHTQQNMHDHKKYFKQAFVFNLI